jgi:pimeloyl-ACP methyl ester carboxylesterase
MNDLQERDVSVNGINLRVASWGDPVGAERTVLLIHGLTANSRYWFELGPKLAARDWCVRAPDLRGRGRGDKPRHGYGLPIHANDLLGLCDALELSTVDLVGHSLGALIGLYLAAVHPTRVRRLVLVDAGGTLPADTYDAIAPALARLGEASPSLDAYLAAMRETTRLPWEPFGERYYRYDAELHPDGTVTSSVPKSAIAEEQAAAYFTRTDALPVHVTAPTLIVRATDGMLGGERGQILPRAEAERLLAAIPDSRLVEIPDTDHYTVVVPERFRHEVIAFLDDA